MFDFYEGDLTRVLFNFLFKRACQRARTISQLFIFGSWRWYLFNSTHNDETITYFYITSRSDIVFIFSYLKTNN